MPEKNVTKDLWILILIVPLLVTCAKSLNRFFNSDAEFNWIDFLIQAFVGTISGMLFGLLGCWLVADSQAAVGAISGFGAVLGIAGIAKIAKQFENKILKKLE